MVCPNCGCTEVDKDPARGDTVCIGCGNVLESTIIVSEVQFAENSGGGSSVIGQFVSSEGGSVPSMTLGSGFHTGMGRESRTITLNKGKRKINDLCVALKLNQHSADTAFNFFKMAVCRRLTKGRKSAHVIAACVYLVCRTEGTAHMLLDFSDILQINVYTLGKTYLALARLLCINTPAIDPSLLIPRFAHKLEFGDKEHEVSMTALRLVARMKRDWMSTGRRPSGLCGAALLVASRIHNFCRLKKDIIKVVKVCESTLRKRLVEFEETASGSLTVEEFQTIDLEEEADPPCFTLNRKEAKQKQIDEQINMNEVCVEITDLSNEIEKELETKASKQAQKLEREAALFLKTDEVMGDTLLEDPNAANAAEFLEEEIITDALEERTEAIPQPVIPISSMRPTAASLGLTSDRVDIPQLPQTEEDDKLNGELDLTGLDDKELDEFILTEQEKLHKEKVWMSLNGEFLKEQEEKARKRAEEEALKPPKAKKRRRKNGIINASTAGEAMEKMLHERKISSKINYDVLKNLTNGPSSCILSKAPPAQDNGITQHQLESTSVIDETPIIESGDTGVKSTYRSRTVKPSVKGTSRATNHTTKAAEKIPEPPLLQSVVESGPVNNTHLEDEEEEEEQYDEDEPVSAAQLLGHSYTGDDFEEDYYD